MPAALIESWEGQAAERRGENSSLDWKPILERGQEVVANMHAAGVPFLAGTDLGVAFVYPGSSLLDELVALVEIGGLQPLEALRAASVHAAAWLGWDGVGSIREGYRADMLLLEGDPLADMENVKRIHTVISRGVVHGPDARARWLVEPAPADDD